ncbi:MAG: bifunctional phosphopantothenoylcysteine decarboxylase/phosphopantothenate--cysteine ligase CoaBC [Limosilactobacillus sp.]|uniref:bifunctional phosphopantothenoylcysteine decarboxylase/phosphopantothenate--cysteine ligase CoaBC n=1 Tax=Limosilactobacillus sp. TaxID=2773925 RepID=UPI00270E7466|nr:bifunctional phosphopantothenoylcysteine decarboxylase/phosphopantothenate--cysteine ligase CoaBC [Limosilactobacillus sp.]
MANVTVYLTGSVAAYKGVEVVRGLQKKGHDVRVVMTESATKLVGPTTLAALTKHPVLTSLWDEKDPIPHIELADWTELAVVVPATANIIAKMANGIADDAASTTLLATAANKVVVPAMNSHMWAAPATQRNLATLKSDGVVIMEPASGRLAEGYSGKGRLPEPDEIVAFLTAQLTAKGPLAGRRVVITAGGTREPIDPVRFIGNRSSGKMGVALTQAAINAGAKVTLIVGQVSVPLPQSPRLEVISVETTEQLHAAVDKAFTDADALIMAAAVADYKPVNVADHKVKKSVEHNDWAIDLTETTDVLKTVAHAKKDGQVVIGFAAETHDLIANAQKKLQTKGADVIVANSVSGENGAFGNDQDQVTILAAGSDADKWPAMPKVQVAEKLIDLLDKKLKSGD